MREETEQFACDGKIAASVGDSVDARGFVATRDELHLGVKYQNIQTLVAELFDSSAISEDVKVDEALLLPYAIDCTGLINRDFDESKFVF